MFGASERMDIGRRAGYQWLVCTREIRGLSELVPKHHRGMLACITAFDSGPISPSDEETQEGWRLHGGILVSPPLTEGLVIPSDQYDEWYVLSDSDLIGTEPEVFVNYGGFTLLSPQDISEEFDPTWEKPHWLSPIQERFWAQLETICPETYVAMGDNDVVVSRNQEFMEAVLRQATSGI